MRTLNVKGRDGKRRCMVTLDVFAAIGVWAVTRDSEHHGNANAFTVTHEPTGRTATGFLAEPQAKRVLAFLANDPFFRAFDGATRDDGAILRLREAISEAKHADILPFDAWIGTPAGKAAMDRAVTCVANASPSIAQATGERVLQLVEAEWRGLQSVVV